MANFDDITTKEIAELIIKLQGKSNKKTSIDYLIKKTQETIRDNENIKGHTGIKNQRLYNLNEATIIINKLTKNRKNIKTKEPIQSLTETQVYQKLLSDNQNHNIDPQALAIDKVITKKVANLLQIKKTEFYLAGIAAQEPYILDVKKLKKDIQDYFVYQEIEYDVNDTEPTPQRIINLENHLDDYYYYKQN